MPRGSEGAAVVREGLASATPAPSLSSSGGRPVPPGRPTLPGARGGGALRLRASAGRLCLPSRDGTAPDARPDTAPRRRPHFTASTRQVGSTEPDAFRPSPSARRPARWDGPSLSGKVQSRSAGVQRLLAASRLLGRLTPASRSGPSSVFRRSDVDSNNEKMMPAVDDGESGTDSASSRKPPSGEAVCHFPRVGGRLGGMV